MLRIRTNAIQLTKAEKKQLIVEWQVHPKLLDCLWARKLGVAHRGDLKHEDKSSKDQKTLEGQSKFGSRSFSVPHVF